MKSIIGFGNYRDLTVQDLINLNRHKELLNIYYKLGNIDFCEEVKEHCHITPCREIQKPGKDYTAYSFFHGEILSEIIDDAKNKRQAIGLLRKMAFANRMDNKSSNIARLNKENSKIKNRNRNQKK